MGRFVLIASVWSAASDFRSTLTRRPSRRQAILRIWAGIGRSTRLWTRSAAELAGPMHVHAPSLHRLMRTAASMNIPTERTDDQPVVGHTRPSGIVSDRSAVPRTSDVSAYSITSSALQQRRRWLETERLGRLQIHDPAHIWSAAPARPPTEPLDSYGRPAVVRSLRLEIRDLLAARRH